MGVCVIYGGLRNEKCDVDIGIDFSVLGDVCVKSYFGKKLNVHKSVKHCERRVNQSEEW